MTPEAISQLLDRLDALAREREYPPAGLRIHGSLGEREAYLQIVAQWLREHSQEAQR